MMDKDDIESKVKKAIEKFVGEHWASTQSICYLSSIGIYLNATVPDNRLILSKGLREFLRQYLIVQVVQFPGIEQKVGAVPLSVSLPDDIRALFAQRKPTSFSPNRNVYLQEFWDAFIRPIEELSRYVLVDETDGVTIYDGAVDGEGYKAYEITPQDLTTKIPYASVADKVSATHSAIDHWLEKHSLEPSVFLRPRRQKLDITVGSRLSQFIGAFDELPPEDLSRINIPLDILVRLNSKR